MTAREQLFAYVATLATLGLVFISALVAGIISGAVIAKIEAFGLGTSTGGRIGVLRIPSARNPVAATDSGDVNVTSDPKGA